MDYTGMCSKPTLPRIGKCVKGGYIADLDAPHGQICKMPNASAPQQLYLASAAFASAMVESR